MRASRIGKELSEALGKSQVGEKSKFKAFKAVIRGNWDADDIKKIESRLNNLRSELQLRVLVSIKKELNDPQNEPYKPMLATLESLVNHQAQSGDDRKRMMESLTRTEELAVSLKDELLVSREQILAELRTVQPTFATSEPRSIGAETNRKQVEDAILASLWYPDIHDREDSISDAHKKTFEWLFRDPATSDVPFSSLVDFLGEETGKSYWITGKPGSGKSTAMKFLLGDPRTSELLGHWSGGKRVIQASFYFFYNGSDMQKSELGLLSSLLHTLLKEERSLIPIGFRERFEAALSGQVVAQRPSIFETRRALKEVISHSPDIFFFLAVDGLDEFDPRVSTTDVVSLLQLTRSLSSFNNAKLVLSSRPLSAFEQGFTESPSLAIHTLTKYDIQSYVFDELQSHPRLKMMMARDELQTKTLIWSIGDNSSGVFLWVRLVVQSLLEGLENSDGLAELQARLQELPRDLHTLYSVMLSRISPQYVPQTAKLLQIVEKAPSGGGQLELSLLGLWYADQWTDKDLFGTGSCPISQDQIVARTEDMTGRLKSRCLGLIEVQPSPLIAHRFFTWDHPPGSDISDPNNERLILHVKFIHRTVSEFLADKDIRCRFVDIPSLSTFDPKIALARSAIAIVKEFIPGKPTDWTVLIKLAENAARRVANLGMWLEKLSVDPSYQLKLLRELDEVMSEHMVNQRIAPWDSMGWKHRFVDGESCDAHWSSYLDRGPGEFLEQQPSTEPFLARSLPRLGRKASFMSFLVILGVEGPLQQMVNIHGKSILHKDGLPLLGYALCYSFPWLSFIVFVIPEVVRFLVANGCSPHEIFCGKTVWDWFLQRDRGGMSFSEEPGYVLPYWLGNGAETRTMLELLGAGADVNGRILWSTPGHKLPPGIQESVEPTVTACTLLLAARRSHKLITGYLETLPTETGLIGTKEQLEFMIKLLEDGEAVEKEWDLDGNMISSVPTQDEAAEADEEPAKITDPSQKVPPYTLLKSDDRDTKPNAHPEKQTGISVKEEKNRVMESASHMSGAQAGNEASAIYASRGRVSRIRGKFGNWMKSLTGKSKAVT